MSLTKSSQFANDSADDDNDMRCVLDIVCINDPNERNIKFQVMNQDFESLKIQAEKLINENPDEVKETLIIFTKIVQRIKDSREKLKSLKMRLRVCKNTFSSSFEKTDNITRMYLKSKECASLLKKISVVVESTRSISLAISQKNFSKAAFIVSQTQKYLKSDLIGIEAITNCRMEVENNVSNLYKSILTELTTLIFDETPIKDQKSRIDFTFRDFDSFPFPSEKQIYGNWETCHSERIDQLAQNLKTINKLKIGLACVIKFYREEVIKILHDIISQLRAQMVENMEISRCSDSAPMYNKRALCFLFSLVVQRMDIIHQKTQCLIESLRKHLEGYEADWTEHTEESLLEANPDVLECTSNQAINLCLKNLLKGYLTYPSPQKEDSVVDHSFKDSTLQQVFSLRSRLSASSRKGFLYKFGNTIDENDSESELFYDPSYHLGSSTMRNLCEPSIKYFKYIYLQLRSFAQIFINFYKIQNFENPLVCFLENYQSNYNIQYSIRCINNLYNTNYIGSVEKYRPNSQAKYSTDVKDTSILKISYDFSRSVKHIFGRIRCIPLHAADFIKLYCDTFHESLFKNFMTTINGLTVVNDITILAAQISNSLPEYEIMQVFELFKDYNASWENLSIQDSPLESIDVMLCSFIQSQPLTQDHVMSAVNFKLLVVIFENLKYLSTITSDFSSRVFSVGNFEKVYHNNKHVTCGLSKFIYTPACLKDLVSEAMSTDVLSPLSLINDEIGQLLHRCLTILLFDARFHVALYLQALFKISDLDPTYIHPNIYQLEKYLHSIYESIMHLSSNKISSFLFFHLTNFIHIYLIEMAKNDIHIKARASFIRRCVYVLKIQLIDSHLSNIHILDETISFFDLFEMDLDEILKSVIEKGPIFTFQTYSIVINAIKDQSLSSDLFNLRIKTLKEYFSEDSYQL